MLRLSVSARSPAAITAALRKIREMVRDGSVARDAPVRLVLEAGTYNETVRYNMSNPLVIESAPGTNAADCVVRADNCERFNRGVENRGVFAIGPSATSVTLRNFMVENTHIKAQGASQPADSAEAFVWNNTAGSLRAQGMRFVGRQSVVFVRGSSWFSGCLLEGDVDVITGEPACAFFEDCTVYLREDNRGDCDAFAVKSGALSDGQGFVFSRCTFDGDPRAEHGLYVCRTSGLGNAQSAKDWDNVALLHSAIAASFDPSLVWDDDLALEVFPRGNAKSGIREYGTQTVDAEGASCAADTSARNVRTYLLTDDDYFAGYASRYLLLRGTAFAED